MYPPRIPKRLIHIWGTAGKPPESGHREADLPLARRASLVNARALHPDYDHRFFDDSSMREFLDAECPQYQDAYFGFPLAIQRFDFFRYLAIYRLGGFYLDLDVYLARSLEPLRAYTCVFPFEELTLSQHLRERYQWDWEVGNFAFGAEPGHPFILAVIRNCVRGLRDPEWTRKMHRGVPRLFRGQFIATNSTGPGLVTRTLAEREDLRSSVTVLFPDDVCEPSTWHSFGDYGAHLMSASWRRKEGFVRRRLARAWENRSRRRLHVASQRQGPRRDGEWGQAFSSRLEPNPSQLTDSAADPLNTAQTL